MLPQSMFIFYPLTFKRLNFIQKHITDHFMHPLWYIRAILIILTNKVLFLPKHANFLREKLTSTKLRGPWY